MDISDASTIPETSHLVAALLHEDGHVHLTFTEYPAPRSMHSLADHLPPEEPKLRRIVIALLPDKKQIMVAMEGNGCIFMDAATNLNHFVFIQNGFSFDASVALATLFSCMNAFMAASPDVQQKLLQQHQEDRS